MAEFIRRLIIPIPDLWQPLMEILQLRMACMSLFTNRWIHTTPTAYQAGCFPFFSVSFGCAWQCAIKAWFLKVDEFWIFVESCLTGEPTCTFLDLSEVMSIWLLVKPCPSMSTQALTMTTLPMLNQATRHKRCHDAPSPFSTEASRPFDRGFSVYSIGSTVTGFNATGLANWNLVFWM